MINDFNALDALDCVSRQEVQAEQPKIIRCKDCISRQAAIDAVWNCSELQPKNKLIEKVDAIKSIIMVPSAQEVVKVLPSAQRTGRWIIVTDSRGRHAECPYCGEWKYHSKQKFCGECGAKMEEEER